MTPKERISTNIRFIKEYTVSHQDLRDKAHHFLYDKRYNDAQRIRYIVMGINPGEPPSDIVRGDTILEETSEYDYLRDKPTRPAIRWRNTCECVCRTLDIALTEVFFWSSYGTKELKTRFGRLDATDHLRFCAKLNADLIEIHAPSAIILVGLEIERFATDLYGLRQTGKIIRNSKGHRLIVPYTDESGKPWILVKHFSARLSIAEKATMREYVARLVTATS